MKKMKATASNQSEENLGLSSLYTELRSRRTTRAKAPKITKPTQVETASLIQLTPPVSIESTSAVQLAITEQPLPPSPNPSQPDETMGYTWDKRAIIAKSQPWYNIEELMALLINIRKANYSIVEQRQQMLTALNEMRTAAPFDRNVRFPEGVVYICETHGDWIRKFQQLRTSLSFKDFSAKDKGSTSKPGLGDGYQTTALDEILMWIPAPEVFIIYQFNEFTS
ncbi:uncharacterized protein LOC116159281 [Photinus pyralis]|uniref:uncharacterized protein LOC116159281 n=1 Tax=Photinus pyralis TaxID=7054 RepID=UPI00126766D7|nr:uncharacterized protein LOC116159281 [Photinus pyralis]